MQKKIDELVALLKKAYDDECGCMGTKWSGKVREALANPPAEVNCLSCSESRSGKSCGKCSGYPAYSKKKA